MLDKLLVADPNHSPRFFASADFAEHNSPITFLFCHMCDLMIRVLKQKPRTVRATAFAHKLKSLRPQPVKNGMDMVTVEMEMEHGGIVNIVSGWHLPNDAHALTVQSARIICADGMIDLDLDKQGLCELSTANGRQERGVLFRTFGADGSVTGGYGISSPARICELLRAASRGELSDAEWAEALSPFETGLWTVAAVEAAEQSLAEAARTADGVTHGTCVDVLALVEREGGGGGGAAAAAAAGP